MPRPQLSVLFALAAALGLFHITANASETMSSEPAEYVVARGKTAPIVDGVLDDPAWEGIEPEPIERELSSGSLWSNLGDFEATFRALWRDGNLFVAVEINDDDVFVDNADPEATDRLVLAFPGPDYRTVLEFVVPIFHTNSLEDPLIPFAAWSSDGRILEFSIETDAMFSIDSELLANFYYIDVDVEGPEQRIGWVPSDPALNESQLGALQFQRGVDPDTMRQTTWGSIKNLY